MRGSLLRLTKQSYRNQAPTKFCRGFFVTFDLMIKVKYESYIIEVFGDSYYKENSADNSHHYDTIYGDDSEFDITSLHGMKIYDVTDKLLKCIAVSATGGATGIHKNSFAVKEDLLLICCCDSVFCLSLPSLTLLWQRVIDTATCFGIYIYNNDYIVHGEMEISRISDKGETLWQYSGRDIFTTLSVSDVFSIKDNKITVKDWLENIYTIDADTGASFIDDYKPQ